MCLAVAVASVSIDGGEVLAPEAREHRDKLCAMQTGDVDSGAGMFGLFDRWPRALPDPTTLLTVAIVVGGLLLANLVMRRVMRARRLQHDVVMIGLTLLGLLMVIWTFDSGYRDSAFTIVGILVSAAIALSSGTLVGNGMAGLMLRAQRHFKTGDYIRVGDVFGRVSERGLFFTEIQNELRDLVTLPNSQLASEPVTVMRTPATLVRAEISLGYDVAHTKVENLLCDAAVAAGLDDAFVHILALGDFSISYRVSGLLADTKRLLSARSLLNASVLDTLHAANVEIVSPAFMNQRQIGDQVMIPPPMEAARLRSKSRQAPEAVMFDKAEEAATKERLETLIATVDTKIETLRVEAAHATEGDREPLARRLEQLESRRTWLVELIEGSKAASGTN